LGEKKKLKKAKERRRRRTKKGKIDQRSVKKPGVKTTRKKKLGEKKGGLRK